MAAVLRCEKHSRQNTGRPCVGLKGTVVSLPHCEQVVRVSTRPTLEPGGAAPRTATRLALHALQRLGSFFNCLSWKNNCSPAVKTNSAPQSMHFNILSWNSIEDAPFSPHPSHRTHLCGTTRPYIPPQLTAPGLGPTCPERAWITAYTRKTARFTMSDNNFRKTERRAPPAWAALGRGRPRDRYSCSFRAFLRLRLRARASFTRFLSPGFR